MIDLHSHILPGIDDGASNMDETLEMCRIAKADGIHTIIASPHSKNGVYNNDEKTILPALKRVKEVVRGKGISIEIIPAVDMHINPEVVSFFKQNSQLLLGGRYVLLEFPSQSIPPYTEDFFFKMKLKGYIPIITHPERNTIIQNDITVLQKWMEGGAIVQVTAMSLTGEFGEKARKVSLKMVQSGLAHIIATDAHSPNWRKPILSKGRKILEEILDSNGVKAMVEDIPKKILNGEAIERIEMQNSSHTSTSFLRRLFEKRL